MKNIYLTIICILGFSNIYFAQAQGVEENPYEVYLTIQKELNQSLSTFFYGNYFKMYSLNEVEFINTIDSLRKGYIKLLENFKNDNPDFDKTVIFNESKEIQYSFDKLLVEYPYYHERFTGEQIAINKRLEQNFSDFNNPQLLSIEPYIEYLKAFLYAQSNIELQQENYKKIDNQKLTSTFNLIEKHFSNQEALDYLKYYYLNHHIDNFGIKNIEKLYDNFINTCEDTSYTNKIKGVYTEELNGRKNHLIKTYKTVDNFDLEIHLFLPENVKRQEKRPVIVYFSGGSWSEGKPDWNFYSCQSYAKKGWVGVTVEYRLADRHGTLPFEAVMDAKSAIRWLRENADEYNIDPERIVASGNSAGGHLVLATALVENWNEKTDNLNFSCIPNVLMVNSGVYDLTEEHSWIRAALKKRNLDENLVIEISPNSLTQRKLPPTLLIHGTNDRNVAFSTAVDFVEKMNISGNNIVFKPIENAGHFIWWGQYGKKVAEIRENYLKEIEYE